MKASEFKIQTVNKLFNLVDDYFNGITIQERLINGTIKQVIKNKQHQFDDWLEMFTDENGNIQTDEIKNAIADMGNIELSIKDLAKQFNIPSYLLPNKVLIFTKQDIINLLG